MEFTDKVMDYDALLKDQEREIYVHITIATFESDFDSRMKKLLQAMVEGDLVEAMLVAVSLHGHSGQVWAFPFKHCLKKFSEYIRKDCERIDYKDYQPNEDRPPYKVLDSFTDEKRLIAFDYLHLIVEQALLLRKEMSKYTKSIVPNDLYQKEAQEIRKLHDDLKKKLTQNTSNGLKSMKYMSSPVSDVDPPVVYNNKCCDKCLIF